jgi:hypothetical protein
MILNNKEQEKRRSSLFLGSVPLSDEQSKIKNIFLYSALGGTVVAMLFAILLLITAFASVHNGSHFFDGILKIFNDFVYIMNTSLEESPYIVEQSSYPPAAILILLPFALICKGRLAAFSAEELTLEQLTGKMLQTPEFWISYLLFFFITTSIIVCLTIKKFAFCKQDAISIAIMIPFSAPFVFAIMRGNTIYFALIFLVLFLVLKDSQSPILREISYMSLAMSGAIKIYPLFFGVFLLRKKKIFASVRVAIYFVAIFWLSFFFFKNGLDNITPFLEHLGGFMSTEDRLLGTNNISISAQLYKLLTLISPSVSETSPVYTVSSMALMVITFLLSTYTAIATRKDFSRYVICFCVVTLIPTISYFYTIIFAIVPFLEYIRQFGAMPLHKRIFYFFAFNILFITPLMFGIFFIHQSLTIMAMLVFELTEVVKERRTIRLEKKKA